MPDSGQDIYWRIRTVKKITFDSGNVTASKGLNMAE